MAVLLLSLTCADGGNGGAFPSRCWLGARGDAVAVLLLVGASLYPIVYLFRLYAHGCVVWFNYCCISLFSKKSSETANVLPDHYEPALDLGQVPAIV